MARILLTADDDTIGTGLHTALADVIGTNADSTVYVENDKGTVTFDASFNAGGDVIVLTGDANSYSVVRSGSSIILTNADGASFTIPAGVAGVEIQFGDETLTLTANVDANQITLGDQVVTTTVTPVDAPDPVAQLEALEAAQAHLDAEAVDFSAAVVAAGLEADVDLDDNNVADGFDPVANDYVAQAESNVELAKADLATARAANSDASLDAALTSAQADVQADTDKYLADGTADPAGTFTAAQLQTAAANARQAFDTNVASKGDALTLAGHIEDAIALYLVTGDDTAGNDLAALQSAIDTLQAAAAAAPGGVPSDGDLDTFYAAVETANAGVFGGVDGASELDDGARGDAVESQLAVLNTQAGLDGTADNAEDAFAATGHAAAIDAANADIAARDALIADVDTAQGHLTAVTAAAGEYAAAQHAVDAATDALDFTINPIDAANEVGTADADLFTVDATHISDLGFNVTIDDFQNGDIVYLGSGVTLGADKAAGDNNVLEVFLGEVAGNAVLYVENSNFGSSNGAAGDFTTITLNGVSADSLHIENGVVSFDNNSAAIA
jgi:hypothetical protein